MYKDKSICIVVPAYNEATQIGSVIETMPDYVDYVFIVDDASQDKTVEIVKRYQKKSKKIQLIEHKVNKGVGGAITTGYKRARDNDILGITFINLIPDFSPIL